MDSRVATRLSLDGSGLRPRRSSRPTSNAERRDASPVECSGIFTTDS